MLRRFVRSACFCLVLLSSPALPAFAQGAGVPASPAMQEANALYAAQKWAEAAKAYEQLARENPKNGMMWFRLGSSLHALKQYERAIDAFRHSVEIGNNATAMYNIACGYALLGRKEESFDWLFRSLKAGFTPAGAGLASDSDLASLAGDARFKEASALAEKTARPCMATPEHRQFDFWVGEWNVYNPQGTQVGTNTIESVAVGCIVMENWTGAGGGVGKSMNFYDPATRKWRQTWVDGRGGVLEFAGEFRDGAMRYTGETAGANGARTQARLTFFHLGPDRVRQLWEQSSDGGKTWSVVFDGMYLRKGTEGAAPTKGGAR